MHITYRKLTPSEVEPSLFSKFQRRQEVSRCWRREGGEWVVKHIAFTEDWEHSDLVRVCGQISRAIAQGGCAWGAFIEGGLKGFANLEGELIGSRRQYAVLQELHVSQDCRRLGLGRELFRRAADSARELGAEKLYISTMSAVETQDFYLAMGCAEAVEPDPRHVELEPCDVQREYIL